MMPTRAPPTLAPRLVAAAARDAVERPGAVARPRQFPPTRRQVRAQTAQALALQRLSAPASPRRELAAVQERAALRLRRGGADARPTHPQPERLRPSPQELALQWQHRDDDVKQPAARRRELASHAPNERGCGQPDRRSVGSGGCELERPSGEAD
jgi:hypothetical protein